ncbi:MAG: HK97-gp10 family putative phage morphogenesis protein [Rhizobiaceae bacterium]
MSNILGLAKLDRKLKRLPEVAKARIRAAMEEWAQDIVDLAKSLVPVDSGELRDSIGWTWGAPPRGSITIAKVARSKLGKDLTITIYAGDERAFWARWVEFGTSEHLNRGLFKGSRHPGTKAQPFFYPAFRANRKSGKRKVNAAIRKAAREVAAS